MTAALLIGVLVAGGVYLIMRRELLRVTLGFILLGHAVNVLFIAAGGLDRRNPALLGQSSPDEAADPLPQAFVLTAIVITFGITVFLLALMRAEGLRGREERAARTDNDPDVLKDAAPVPPPEVPQPPERLRRDKHGDEPGPQDGAEAAGLARQTGPDDTRDTGKGQR